MKKKYADPTTGDFVDVEVSDDGKTVKVEGDPRPKSDTVDTVVKNPTSGDKNGAGRPKKKMPVGKKITKETAKQYQISSARAKKLRKEARAKMLAALTLDLDLGAEMLKAMKTRDDQYLAMIEKATRLVGLQHDQSQEALAQRFEVHSKNDTTLKTDGTIKFVIEDAKQQEG